MVGLATGNRCVTAHLGLELLTRQKGSLDVIVSLLNVIKESQSESSQLGALASMEAYFLGLFHAGESVTASIAKQNRSSVGLSERDVECKAHWASEAYTVFVNALLELSAKTGVVRAVHVRALIAFMELVRSETPGSFSNSLYWRLCTALVGSKGPITSIVGVLQSQFYQYADVRYFTYLNIRKLAVERFLSKDDGTLGPLSLQMFVRNLYELLSHLPTNLPGDSGKEGSDNKALEKIWCRVLSKPIDNGLTKEVDSKVLNRWTDATLQKDAFISSWRAFVRLTQPLGAQKKNYGHLLSHVLSTSNPNSITTRDSFLTSLSDELVDERLKEMAVCKESTSDNTYPGRRLGCGRDVESADWVLSAARGKEEDDDDDHDDDDDDEDEDDEEEEDDDDNKVEAGDDEEDVEGEEEEADDEEADDDGEADDNGEGEDEDGEEGEDEDADGDEDGDEEPEEEDEEDGDQDAEDEDDEEGESEEDLEPPKKKRK